MKKVLILFLSVCFITTAFAHEYVLIAYNFVVKKGETLELHLFVADGFNVELERPVQKEITKRFELISENGTKDLLAEATDGNLPILETPVDFEGLGLIHMERDYATNTLPTDEFLDYLKVDNIENVMVDETKQEQSERYTRYLKTLIQSNPKTGDDIYKREVGQAFEIILLDNPYTLKKDGWLNAKILFMGKPLANKVITARNRDGNKAAIHHYSRTDSNGVCSFKLERKGQWFLHATHMVASRDQTKSDWESFWTTYSFGLNAED